MQSVEMTWPPKTDGLEFGNEIEIVAGLKAND
jgi:hypothetical protein